MWNYFQKVEVVVGWVFGLILEIFVNLSILLEHVKDGVFSMIYTSKSVHNDFLLALIAKCYWVNFVIHLHFLFLIITRLHILLPKFLISSSISSLSKMQLARNFWDVEGSTDFTLRFCLKKVVYHRRNIINIIQIKFLKWFLLIVLLDYSFILINVCPSQIVDDFISWNEVDGCPQLWLDQEAWDVWENYFKVYWYMRVFRWIRAHRRCFFN